MTETATTPISLDNFLGEFSTVKMYAPDREKYEPVPHEPRIVQVDLFGRSLPGQGTYGKGCGDVVPKSCPSCGHHHWGESSCRQKMCPSCYNKWAYIQGEKASTRMWVAKAHWFRGYPVRIVHVVVSHPVYDGWEEADYRKRTQQVLRRHGLVGGSMVCHTMREEGDMGRVPDGYIHYHCVSFAPGNLVAGGMPEDGRAVFAVIKDHETKSYSGMKNRVQIAKCITYILTHASVAPHTHAVTWWGIVSYNRMNQRTLETEFPEAYQAIAERSQAKCPQCHVPGLVIDHGTWLRMHQAHPGHDATWWKDYASRHPDPFEAALLEVDDHAPPQEET